MSITIHPPLETELRARAEAEGITIEAYLERILHSDEEALIEIESAAMEGLRSGDSTEVGAGYWEKLHERVDKRLKRSC
jgi:hypothetical protein